MINSKEALERKRAASRARNKIVGTCVECSKTKPGGQRYYRTTCRACYARAHRKRRPDLYRAVDRKRYSAQRTSAWRKKNPENWKALLKRHYEKHKPRFFARNASRKKHVKQAIPKWANLKKIQEIYENCPKGHHVDHIVPIRGKNVCGLHVEYNLQYLTAEENCRKNNKF